MSPELGALEVACFRDGTAAWAIHVEHHSMRPAQLRQLLPLLLQPFLLPGACVRVFGS